MGELAPKAQGVHPGAPKSAWGFPLGENAEKDGVDSKGRDISNPSALPPAAAWAQPEPAVGGLGLYGRTRTACGAG
jgi:hypothetical protein